MTVTNIKRAGREKGRSNAGSIDDKGGTFLENMAEYLDLDDADFDLASRTMTAIPQWQGQERLTMRTGTGNKDQDPMMQQLSRVTTVYPFLAQNKTQSKHDQKHLDF